MYVCRDAIKLALPGNTPGEAVVTDGGTSQVWAVGTIAQAWEQGQKVCHCMQAAMRVGLVLSRGTAGGRPTAGVVGTIALAERRLVQV